MVHFINKPNDIVTEALDGMLMSSHMSRLDGYPHIKVIIRSGHDPKKVAIISGGGSGHEPAHAGFVGEGMLTAAVCGEIFASPSVEAVLAAIMAVTGPGGCLLIVKNYTGDRLNFGLAAERAKALGKNVEMVVVADDIALPHLPQPRGVAGTLFVHKIAGSAAQAGKSLKSVAKLARETAEQTVSFGVALESCQVPGNDKKEAIGKGKAELGLGIHGEPGVAVVKYKNAETTAEILMKTLIERAPKAGKYVLLLNNLGSVTQLEMMVIQKAILGGENGNNVKAIIGPAALMTSLDMHGFSISLLPATSANLKALKTSVGPTHWPGVQMVSKIRIRKMPSAMKVKTYKASADAALGKFVRRSCDILIYMERDLNKLDAKVGDGDTGSTLAKAAKSIKRSIKSLPLAQPVDLFAALSDEIARSMGGSSGVLMAIFFSAASDAMGDGQDWQKALCAGLARVKEYGGADIGHRTMIDALSPALDAICAGKTLAQVANAARRGADSTAKMTTAKSGRSAYLSKASLNGVSDPGAEAVARYFEGISLLA